MSWVFPIVFKVEDLVAGIRDALGGQVEHRDERLFWTPDGRDITVSIPWNHSLQPFDADEFAAALWAAWERDGCRL